MENLKKMFVAFMFVFCLITPSIAPAVQNDMLILFSDGDFMSKSIRLYDYKEWYLSNRDNPKNIDALLKEGWSLLQVVPINAKQHYWIFVK